MELRRRQFLQLAASAAGLPIALRLARAETYPSRPITMVVPFPAGGPTDTLARILADRMTAALGQSVVIEDVSGASGRVGLERVARALPDGYTLSIGHWGTHVVIGATMKLPFDVLNDFEPVALLADTPIWLVARRDLPPKNLTELIAWLKRNPGKALVGAVGVGGPSDLNETYFENVTDTKIQMVPYLGGAPLNQDLLGDALISRLAWQRAPIRSCAAANSRHTPSWRNRDGGPRPTFQLWRKPVCRDFTLHFGMGSGCRRERQRRSLDD